MNLFQKIDNHLLHNYPNIWVTKVHVFLPIAIIFMLLIYVFNVILIGYNPKDTFPEGELGVSLMIIPVLVFIVYWFVIQARYNVEKSGGKLSIPLEYMNYFSYFFMFLVSYLLISFIPFTNDIKVANTATKIELEEDIKHLDMGNNVVMNTGSIMEHNDLYFFKYDEFINDYYYRSYKDQAEVTESTKTKESKLEEIQINNNTGKIIAQSELDQDYQNEYYNLRKGKLISYNQFMNLKGTISTYDLYISATRNELDEIANNFVNAHNKYTRQTIITPYKTIVTNNLSEIKTVEYSYTNERYYWRNQAQYKVERLSNLKINHDGALEANYFNSEISKIILSFLLMFALAVWIFKQIHWRDYMFGMISLALTPVIVGIIGVVFGAILRVSESFFWFLLFSAYAFAFIIVIKGYFSSRKSRFSIVTTMYLHIFLPVLPFFLAAFYWDTIKSYADNYMGYRDLFDIAFYLAIGIGLISIAVFKIIYKKMRLLPNHK